MTSWLLPHTCYYKLRCASNTNLNNIVFQIWDLSVLNLYIKLNLCKHLIHICSPMRRYTIQSSLQMYEYGLWSFGPFLKEIHFPPCSFLMKEFYFSDPNLKTFVYLVTVLFFCVAVRLGQKRQLTFECEDWL